QYHTLHLKKMNWRDYVKKDNPVVAALLSKMGFKEEERVQVKAEFMRMLWRLQLNEADQRLIYGFFETYLKLTEEEEAVFVKKLDPMVESINPPVVLTTCNSRSIISFRIPEYSKTPPKVIATIVIETVYIIESRPPRFSNSSTIAFPESMT